MKRRKIKNLCCFEIGELYLFHKSNPCCPWSGSLWGVFDHTRGRQIWLETSSRDLLLFTRTLVLPPEYRFCRQATRSELRDYWYNLGIYENTVLHPPVLGRCDD